MTANFNPSRLILSVVL